MLRRACRFCGSHLPSVFEAKALCETGQVCSDSTGSGEVQQNGQLKQRRLPTGTRTRSFPHSDGFPNPHGHAAFTQFFLKMS